MGKDDREAPRARRRIWCEMLPYEELRSPRVLGLLRRYDLDPIVAVRPPMLGELASLTRLLDALSGAGVRVALWPMLDDERGRWASAVNAAEFSELALRVADTCQRAGVALAEMAFDLEPPKEYAQALAGRAPVSRIARMACEGARSFPRGRRQLLATMDELAARGVATSAAVMPHALFGPIMQRALGTPADLPFSHASVMLYTSMLEGWSRGMVSRGRAIALLAWACDATKARFGAAAGVSLGVVATGALGDEPVYRGPSELAEDVATASRRGIATLTLFDLAGVLARPPAEAWLDAFVGGA